MSGAKHHKMATWIGQRLQNNHPKVWMWLDGSVFSNNKGPFVQVSFGFFQTASHFAWILCNKEAQILRKLRAGFCSNPILLEIALWTAKMGWDSVLIQLQPAFLFKYAICCTALGIRLCIGTAERTGICIPSAGRTLCSGACARCGGESFKNNAPGVSQQNSCFIAVLWSSSATDHLSDA